MVNSRMKIILLFFAFIFHVCHGCHSAKNPPNIVMILTDDLDLELGGLTPLKKTRRWIKDAGITFDNAFVTTPICCPSRSSILTGQYQHNTRVYNNSKSGNCANEKWISGPEKYTFASYLKKHTKYTTFYAGKYLNAYQEVQRVPPGWDLWAGLLGNSKYYDYTLSINGKAEHHGNDYAKDYLTDVIGRKALAFIETKPKNPFLMVLATPAPHAPFTPAPQYVNEFSNLKAPRTPSFNYIKDNKHWLVKTPPSPLNLSIIEQVDEIFRNRWRTLLSVDDMVDNVMTKLNDTGYMDNTVVIFTSDHGFHLGQFGLPSDKRMPYETDIRVPLLVRGPGIKANSTSDLIGLNIDLAPTILDLAGVKNGLYDHMDGKSMKPQLMMKNRELTKSSSTQDKFMVEYRGEGGKGNDKDCYSMIDKLEMSECGLEFGCKCFDSRNNTYNCIRTLNSNINDIYCLFEDHDNFVETYNINQDPFQMNNLYNDKVQQSKDYKILMRKLGKCQGNSC